MSLQELEMAVAGLPEDELAKFVDWFQAFVADAWDRRLEADLKSGRLSQAIQQADADFDAGRCTPL